MLNFSRCCYLAEIQNLAGRRVRFLFFGFEKKRCLVVVFFVFVVVFFEGEKLKVNDVVAIAQKKRCSKSTVQNANVA